MKNTEYMIESRFQLGQTVKRLREEQHITQKQFALMLGLDRSYISRIERGKCNLTIESIILIANGLGLSPSELLEGIGLPEERRTTPTVHLNEAPHKNRRYTHTSF